MIDREAMIITSIYLLLIIILIIVMVAGAAFMPEDLTPSLFPLTPLKTAQPALLNSYM